MVIVARVKVFNGLQKRKKAAGTKDKRMIKDITKRMDKKYIVRRWDTASIIEAILICFKRVLSHVAQRVKNLMISTNEVNIITLICNNQYKSVINTKSGVEYGI